MSFEFIKDTLHISSEVLRKNGGPTRQDAAMVAIDVIKRVFKHHQGIPPKNEDGVFCTNRDGLVYVRRIGNKHV